MALAFTARDATSDEQCADVLQRAADLFEFDAPLFGIQVSITPDEQAQKIVSLFSRAYQEEYAAKGFITADPTVAHCLTRLDEIVWNDRMYAGQRALAMRDTAYDAGLRYGFSVPNRHGAASVSMLSFGRSRPLSMARIRELVTPAAVICACLHSAAESSVVPELFQRKRPALSPRETECLQWLTAGKTDSEIGDIMNLSEETVRVYVKRIKQKFDIISRPQAAAYAIRYRFVT